MLLRSVACAAVLGCSVLAGSVAAQVDRSRVAPPADAAPGIQRASCVLQLDIGSRSNRTFDIQTLNAMLTSTALVNPAAETALGLDPDTWPKVAQIELVPAGSNAVRLGVTVTTNPQIKVPQEAAQAFLDELARRAAEAVEQVGERQEQAYTERREQLEKELAAARERYEAIQVQSREAQAAMAARNEIRTPRTAAVDRSTLETNLLASRARLKVLQEELESAQAQASSPWMELVSAREEIVRALETSPERDPMDLLNAKADLAEARAMAAGQPSTARFDPVERWRTEIVNLKVNIAEAEARLAALDTPEQAAAPATQPAEPIDLNRLRQDEMRARQEVDQLTSQLDQLRRERLGAMVPRLVILDGNVRP